MFDDHDELYAIDIFLPYKFQFLDCFPVQLVRMWLQKCTVISQGMGFP